MFQRNQGYIELINNKKSVVLYIVKDKLRGIRFEKWTRLYNKH